MTPLSAYTVLEAQFTWHSRPTNEAGKPYDLYTVAMVPVGRLLAMTSEAALAAAKKRGYVSPIIEPAREPLQ